MSRTKTERQLREQQYYARLDAERDAHLRKLFEAPNRWLRWPLMPVKLRPDPKTKQVDYNSPRFCGVVHYANLTRVHFSNLWAGVEAARSSDYVDYPSIADLLKEYQVD
jgi:hypothetical protein